MEKISINLNPQKQQPVSSFLGQGLRYALLAALGLGIVVIIGGIFLIIQAGILGYYEGKWKQWADKFQTIDVIKKEVANLESERNEFQKIITPQIQIAVIFQDIFVSLPKNTWLEQLSFKKDSVSLRGYVIKIGEDYLATLDTFVDALKEKKYFSSKFSKITIKSSQTKNYNGMEAMEFVIECVN
ncbi:MAG: PilN domain-containing protein [Candidatus Omnitrophota bacterium]